MNYLDYYCKTFGLIISEDLIIDEMHWEAVGRIVEDKKYVHFYTQPSPMKTSDLLLPALENFSVH